MVESMWERSEGKTEYTITIPVNCEAAIRIPGRKELLVGPGVHRFSCNSANA